MRYQYQNHLEKMVEERTLALKALQAEMVKQVRLVTLGTLTATFTHGARNPLGTIGSCLYVIWEKLKGKDLGVDISLKRAVRAIRRCDGIIEELLDYKLSQKKDRAH